MSKYLFPIITEYAEKLPFYIESIGGSGKQEHVTRPNGYHVFHWLHCTSGEGKLVLDGDEHSITSGMGFFFYPGVPHEYYPVNGNWETSWVTFAGYAVKPLLELIGLHQKEVFHISDIHSINNLLTDMISLVQSKGTINGNDSSILLYKFLLELPKYKNMTGSRVQYSKYKQLEPVIVFIEENFHSSPSLEEIASVIGVTPYHLCRLFKQAYNMRPFVYLTRYRIQKAKELIIASNSMTIKDIAESIGYNDASYFCAIFKQYEGMTPTEFKYMHRRE